LILNGLIDQPCWISWVNEKEKFSLNGTKIKLSSMELKLMLDIRHLLLPTESDKAILAALEEQPFVSIRQLAPLNHLAPSTVSCHLTDKLGYTVQRVRWVSHILSAADEHVRAQLSCQLLELLESQMLRSWHHIVTLDDPGFVFIQTTHAFGFVKE
jgi:hypothetical protein